MNTIYMFESHTYIYQATKSILNEGMVAISLSLLLPGWTELKGVVTQG